MPIVSTVTSRLRELERYEDFEDHMASLLDLARGSDIVVLPELVTADLMTLESDWRDATMNDIVRVAKHEDRFKNWFEAEARARGQYVLAGSTIVQRNAGYFNEATLFGPDGLVVSHEKTHLFRLEGSSGKIKTGSKSTVVDLPVGRIGILICYEIEIPECVDAAVAQGAELLLNPSMTLSEAGAWRVLHCASARAIENQVFVASAQISADEMGFCPGFWGQSRLMAPADAPWPATGVMAATQPNVESVATAELRYEDLYRNREAGAVATFNDRAQNVELYRSWPSRR